MLIYGPHFLVGVIFIFNFRKKKISVDIHNREVPRRALELSLHQLSFKTAGFYCLFLFLFFFGVVIFFGCPLRPCFLRPLTLS